MCVGWSNIPIQIHTQIWKKIEEEKILNSDGKTPWATLNTILLTNSNNSNIKIKSKNPILTIEENSKPQKFSLLLDEIEKNTTI